MAPPLPYAFPMSDPERPTRQGEHPVDNPTAQTWAALLSHWTEFARASVAFPRDSGGMRMRASVVPAIGLQAVTFALGDLDRLNANERAVSLDRAEVLIRGCAEAIEDAWRGEAAHPGLLELIDDARRALDAAKGHRVG